MPDSGPSASFTKVCLREGEEREREGEEGEGGSKRERERKHSTYGGQKKRALDPLVLEDGCWEPNSGPLQEQPVLLIYFQPLDYKYGLYLYCIIICVWLEFLFV